MKTNTEYKGHTPGDANTKGWNKGLKLFPIHMQYQYKMWKDEVHPNIGLTNNYMISPLNFNPHHKKMFEIKKCKSNETTIQESNTKDDT